MEMKVRSFMVITSMTGGCRLHSAGVTKLIVTLRNDVGELIPNFAFNASELKI